MPFKHVQTGYYYCEIVIPGYGQMPRMSLGTKRKRDAKLMEEALRDLGRAALTRPHLYPLLDAVQPQGRGKSGEISPADILRASHETQGYERLLRRLDDPPLSDLIDEYMATQKTTYVDTFASATLKQYTKGERYSYLLEAQHVQGLLEDIERGEEKQSNSVCRSEKRLISKLIRWRSGGVERNRVFADVDYQARDDTRRIRMHVVTPKALARLYDELRAGYWKDGDELAPYYAEVAVLTGGEIRPLSETKKADVSEIEHEGELWGRIYLRGTKKIKTAAGHRDRSILVLPRLWTTLRTYWLKAEDGAEVFPLEYTRFYTMWKKATTRAGLDEAAHDGSPLRPHDLRSVFTQLAERAQVERTKIGAGLGHASLAQTDRYLRNEVALSYDDMRRIAANG